MRAKVLALGKRHGYESSPRRGFVGMARGEQRLDIFWWSKPTGPIEFLVIDVNNGTPRQQIQVRGRDWSDVEAEFDAMFGGES